MITHMLHLCLYVTCTSFGGQCTLYFSKGWSSTLISPLSIYQTHYKLYVWWLWWCTLLYTIYFLWRAYQGVWTHLQKTIVYNKHRVCKVYIETIPATWIVAKHSQEQKTQVHFSTHQTKNYSELPACYLWSLLRWLAFGWHLTLAS